MIEKRDSGCSKLLAAYETALLFTTVVDERSQRELSSMQEHEPETPEMIQQAEYPSSHSTEQPLGPTLAEQLELPASFGSHPVEPPPPLPGKICAEVAPGLKKNENPIATVAAD